MRKDRQVKATIGQVTCPICLSPVEQTEGRGRPREHCSQECRELKAAIAYLETRLDAVSDRLPNPARANMRRELWSILNSSLNPRKVVK